MQELRIMFAVLLVTVVCAAQAHEHHAPHKGTLIEFSPPDEFAHLELVLDQASGKISAYALDGEAEKPVRLAQKEIELKVLKGEKGPAAEFTVIVKAVANVLSGETEGDTSEFAGQNDKLKNLAMFDGQVVAIKVKGKEFKEVKFNFPKGNE